MNPIVLALTGASAQQIGERALTLLLKNKCEVSLILSKGSLKVWESEMGINIPINPSKQEEFWRERLKVEEGSLTCYKWNDHSASIASGSFKTKAMLIVPCSMGQVGRIAAGTSGDLIERCADVHIKESRRLIICPRESPLSTIHLRNLLALSEVGVKVVPPMPGWYTNPKSLDEMVEFIVVRLFDSIDMNLGGIDRWEGPRK